MPHVSAPRLLLAPMLLAAAGCVSDSKLMIPAPADAGYAAPADRAMIVFVRTGVFGGGVKFAILDADARHVGTARADAHFSILVPPGRHVFVSWAEDTQALEAVVEAGRTYYVHVDPNWGAWSPDCDLFALKPGTEDWAELPGWLADTDRLMVDPQARPEDLENKPEQARGRVATGLKALAEYEPKEKARRSLSPEDGVRGGIAPRR